MLLVPIKIEKEGEFTLLEDSTYAENFLLVPIVPEDPDEEALTITIDREEAGKLLCRLGELLSTLPPVPDEDCD